MVTGAIRVVEIGVPRQRKCHLCPVVNCVAVSAVEITLGAETIEVAATISDPIVTTVWSAPASAISTVFMARRICAVRVAPLVANPVVWTSWSASRFLCLRGGAA